MYQVSLGGKKKLLAVGKCAKFKKTFNFKILDVSLYWGRVGRK